jgi:hypothetical protein
MIAVIRTLPGPVEELNAEKQKPNGTYRLQSVINQLKADFFNKCYLCELRAPTSINVEHRIPHCGNDADLKFSWVNLLWACGHCNGTKGDRYHPILDCTDENMRVLNRLDFSFEAFPLPRVMVRELDNNEDTINTANLLNAIHSGSETARIRQVEAANLCSAILEEFDKFLRLIENYKDAQSEQRESLSRRIRRALSKEAAFTAIKACYIKRHQYLREEFGDAIQEF